MSRNFINGTVAEKCRIANTLITDILNAMPDYLIAANRGTLSAACTSLQNIQDELRRSDDAERNPLIKKR